VQITHRHNQTILTLTLPKIGASLVVDLRLLKPQKQNSSKQIKITLLIKALVSCIAFWWIPLSPEKLEFSFSTKSGRLYAVSAPAKKALEQGGGCKVGQQNAIYKIGF
uniref:hypothetical protein n=1 Tax=Helicobacter bizzozeronii TaxID=56877 RepID=UPI001F239323